MTVKLHHATKARAEKLGFAIALEDGDEVVVRVGTEIFGRHSSGSIALKQAEEMVVEEIEEMDDGMSRDENIISQIEAIKVEQEEAAAEAEGQDEDEEGSEEGEGRSVVKRKYKKAYRPFKQTCGDDLAHLVQQHVMVPVKVDGKSVRRVDVVRLRKFAKANDCWDERYASLNVGMQRMNIGNRLRHKVAGGYEVKWV